MLVRWVVLGSQKRVRARCDAKNQKNKYMHNPTPHRPRTLPTCRHLECEFANVGHPVGMSEAMAGWGGGHPVGMSEVMAAWDQVFREIADFICPLA